MKAVRKRKSPAKEKTKEEVPPDKKQNTLDTESPAKKSDASSQLPVRTKQVQRKETAEKPAKLDTGPLLKTVEYLVDNQVSPDVKWEVAAVKANLVNASSQLREFLAFAEGDNNCQLVVKVEAAEETGHGSTGVYVRDPGGAEEWLLIAEALLLRPELITKPQGFLVEVNVSAGKKSPAVDASTTMLHELELHVAPAGHLIMNMVKKGGEEMLDLVLDYMRRADDHISLDGQEQYVRTAARVLERVTPEAMEWAEELLQRISKDAMEQFAVYAVQTEDKAAALAAIQWLSTLVNAIKHSKNSRATPNAPKPVPTQTPISGHPSVENIDREKVLAHLADEVSQRADMIDIVANARIKLGLPVSTVVDLYRTTVVPGLLRLAPEGVTSIKQQLFFLTHHGVPPLVALEAIEAATESTQTGPETGIKIAWPPEEPMFWLTGEEEKNWYYRDGVPTELKTAKNLEYGDYILIDGEKYRVVVSDKKELGPGTTLKSTYNPEMKKWLALTKPTS